MERNKINVYLISFLMPILIMVIAFAVNGFYPFGIEDILVYDLREQVYPALLGFIQKVVNGDSLRWSWITGGGHDYTLYVNGFKSPVYLIAFIFPREYLREAIAVIMLLRIGLTGLFTSMYLRYISGNRGLMLSAFATMYALCGFTLAYYVNIGWFDTFALMPLVIFGVHKLVKEGKYLLFTLSLAAAVFLDYYFGWYICLFTAIMFFVLCVLEKVKIREFIKKFTLIAVCSILAIGMTAVSTFPAFMTILNIPRVTNMTFFQMNLQNIGAYLKPMNSIFNVFGNFTAFSPFSMIENSKLPNLYSGIPALLLFPIFLFSKKISKREKITFAVLFIFFTLIANIPIFYMLLHGFMLPAGFPARYSFMLSFILILSAYRVYVTGLEKHDLKIMLIWGALVHVLAFLGPQENVWLSLSFTVIYLIVFTVLIFIKREDLIPLSKLILVVVIFLEFSIAASIAVTHNTINIYNQDRDTFPMFYDEVQELLSMRQHAENEFARTEFSTQPYVIPTELYGFEGISYFSPTINTNVNNFMLSLGISGNESANAYFFREGSPFTNAFLNIRYMLDPIDYSYINNSFWNEVTRGENISLSANRYPLPLGFMVNTETLDYSAAPNAPFRTQNELFNLSTGINGDLFESAEWDEILQRSDGDTTRYQFILEMPRDGFLYLYVLARDADDKTAQFTFADKQRIYDTNVPHIFSCGNVAQGETVTVDFSIENQVRPVVVHACVLNFELFEEGYALLADEVLELTEFSDTYIRGRITVLNDGLLYTSIPHVNRWLVYVDGEEREITPIGNAMIGVLLEAGEHEIEFRYHNPDLFIGIIISIVSIILFFTVYVTCQNLFFVPQQQAGGS